MQIHVIPAGRPMPHKELEGRIASGWIKVGRQVMETNNRGVATLDNPNAPPFAEFDVWVLPEPMIPVSVVVGSLVQMASSGGDMATINMVSEALFGADINTVSGVDQLAIDKVVAGARDD
jgi:hypothetical protein